MAVLGIESIIYCVDDISRSVDFFEDFGLRLFQRDQRRARFKLPDSANVVVQSQARDAIPGSGVTGPGVHEVIWGVDCQEHLDQLVAQVESDRPVRRDPDGTAHFVIEGGIPMGLRLWPTYRMPDTSVDPVNSPGNINRMNTHRKWIARAVPKRVMHVVYMVPEPETCMKFMRDRLDFRLTDVQRGLGMYMRCDGSNDHHTIFFFNSRSPMAGATGDTRFHHANFHVTDLDEIMVGKLHLERRGWAASPAGLGRHRIGSALFCYFPCPAGGEAEYGADQDQLDDGWVPRNWDGLFGYLHWAHNSPPFWIEGPNWDVTFHPDNISRPGEIRPRVYNEPATAAAAATLPGKD